MVKAGPVSVNCQAGHLALNLQMPTIPLLPMMIALGAFCGRWAAFFQALLCLGAWLVRYQLTKPA